MKKISLVVAASVLALLTLASPASADVNAPDAKWTGPTYSRMLTAAGKGEVKFRFWNKGDRTNDLKLGMFSATIPYECGKERRTMDFEYDEREDKGKDDATVDVVNDYGVKTIKFKLDVKRGEKTVWAIGKVKFNEIDSNSYEPDASGLIWSTTPLCHTKGYNIRPLGFKATRGDLKV